MKKFLISLFIALLCVSCVFAYGCSGCGKSDPGDSSGGNATVEKPDRLALADDVVDLYSGETYSFSFGKNAEYTTSDENIASVTADGLLTAVADGSAFITVRKDGVSGVCRVNVYKAEEYLRFSNEKATVVKGGEKTLSAEIIRNKTAIGGKIEFSVSSPALTYKIDGDSVTVSADTAGYYEIYASHGKLKATCLLKVVNDDAVILGKPIIRVENCKTLVWDDVAGADEYEVLINGGDKTEVCDNSLDISELTDDLLCGETLTLSVSATAKAKFDVIDGGYSSVIFAHEYTSKAITEYSCIVEGTIGYECSVCGKEYSVENYLAPHNYVDGACTVCKKVATEKILYLYDEVNECYYVAGADGGFNSETVYFLAEYNDGKNGTHPVKYFAMSAFQSNKIIKRVIIPESITEFVDKRDAGYNIITKDGVKVSSPLRGMVFDACVNLEYVSARGITYFPAVDNMDLSYGHDNFRDCYNLTQIILGNGIYNEGRSFMNWLNTPAGFTPKTDVYVYGDKVGALSTDYYSIGSDTGANNNLLTGDVFYYDETSADCFRWHYAADGETIVSTGKHVYSKGRCKKCGAIDDHGVKYAYDEVDDCYYVSDNRTYTDAEAVVLSEYDDGKNGLRAVTYVKNGAFEGNTKIERVILPASVTQLDGSVFQGCENLRFVSMVGIGDMAFCQTDRPYDTEKVTTNNNFLNCFRLSVVIVGGNYNLYPDPGAQQFIATGEDLVTPIVDIYVDAAATDANVNCAPNGKNNLLTGVIFYKGELDTCLRWNYDADGEIVVSSREHTMSDGKCTVCGMTESYGVLYGYDSANTAYYVAGYTGDNAALEIPAVFNDGIHGEHGVTSVKSGAFADNKTLKSVILPESVKRLDGAVFQGCENLEYVSMIGIEDMIFANINTAYSPNETVCTNNNFFLCASLRTVVVGKNFNLYPDGNTGAQQFPGSSGKTDIYVYGGEEESNVNCDAGTNNGMLSGNVYYYSESKAENRWRFVDGKATLWE